MQNVSNQIQHYPVDLNTARFDLKTALCRFKNSTQIFEQKTAPCRLKCSHPILQPVDLGKAIIPFWKALSSRYWNLE